MATALKLPPNPTPEQFQQAEPLVVQFVIEQSYVDGIQKLTRADGEPAQNQYRVDGPGRYSGIFTDIDGVAQFEFEFTDDGISYTPLNPDEIGGADEE